MAVESLYLRALPASDIFDRFVKLAPILFPNEDPAVHVRTNVPAIAFSESLSTFRTHPEGSSAFRAAISHKDHIIAKNVKIVSNSSGAINIEYSTDDGIVAMIVVNLHPLDRAVRALEAISEHFTLTSYADLVRTTSPAIDQSAIQLRERSVADLQDAVRRMADFLADLAIRESTTRDKLQADMQAAAKKQFDELEATYRDRHADIERQRLATESDFAARERKFQDRMAEIDSRESKYVRRALLNEIKTVIKEGEAAALSTPTARKRVWVHAMCLVTLLASGTLAGFVAYRVLSSESLDWHLLAPLTGTVLTFVATMVYYLKWNDRWFREHADAEFAAKRFKIDILRASWIAELVQEWAKEGKGDLPSELVTAYSRNLFTDGKGSRVSEHPMDHMTSMLKRATEFQVGKNGFAVKSEGRRDASPS
jgi:hypothetical protein